jgi:hypothetical protein
VHRLIPFCAALLPLTLFSAPALAQALAAGSSFTECDGCPEMVVVPAGSFTIASYRRTATGLGQQATSGHVVSWRLRLE